MKSLSPRLLVLTVAAACSASLSSTALAQVAADSAPQSTTGFAEALFDDGLRLMQDAKYVEACPKLAESHRLDPASGTVYNLSICLEKEGKYASAVIAFEESIARSLKDGNKERERLARERLTQLKPLVSRVVVRIGPKLAALEGLDVRFDGASVRQQAWGIEVPMDPGVHTLTAVAQGKREARREVDVNATGKVFELSLDSLEDAPAALAPPRSTTPREAPEVGSGRFVGIGLLGLGGLLVVGGAVSAGFAIDRHAESDRLCPTVGGVQSCSTEGAAAEASANRFAWGANFGIGLGVVSAAVGVVLLLTAKPASRVSAAPRGLVVNF